MASNSARSLRLSISHQGHHELVARIIPLRPHPPWKGLWGRGRSPIGELRRTKPFSGDLVPPTTSPSPLPPSMRNSRTNIRCRTARTMGNNSVARYRTPPLEPPPSATASRCPPATACSPTTRRSHHHSRTSLHLSIPSLCTHRRALWRRLHPP